MKTPAPSRASRPRGAARRAGARRRGAATVEFALCVPVIFFLFLGMIELSRFYVVRHSMDQAVYTGARVGIVPGGTNAEVRQAVLDRLALAGVINPTVTVTPAVITSATDTVTVNASCNYADNAWSLPKYFSNMTIDAQMTLDHEYVGFEE